MRMKDKRIGFLRLVKVKRTDAVNANRRTVCAIQFVVVVSDSTIPTITTHMPNDYFIWLLCCFLYLFYHRNRMAYVNFRMRALKYFISISRNTEDRSKSLNYILFTTHTSTVNETKTEKNALWPWNHMKWCVCTSIGYINELRRRRKKTQRKNWTHWDWEKVAQIAINNNWNFTIWLPFQWKIGFWSHQMVIFKKQFMVKSNNK